MGSRLSSARHTNEHVNRQAINQIYNVEYGYAPVGPIGPIASVPKRRLHHVQPTHHRRKR
jgi:hypothetical protein